MMTKKAIAVLSGGLDSCVATCVYAEDYEIHGITFNYGQKSFKQERPRRVEKFPYCGAGFYFVSVSF